MTMISVKNMDTHYREGKTMSNDTKVGISVAIILFMPLVMAILMMNMSGWRYNDPLVFWHALATTVLVAAAYCAGKYGN